MVRFIGLWLGLLPVPYEKAPPWSRLQQVHLVRLHIQWLRLLPQPDREA